jgi:hypothetical protein
MNSLLKAIFNPLVHWWRGASLALGTRSEDVHDVRTQDGHTRALENAGEMVTDPVSYFQNLVEGLVFPRERDATALLNHKKILAELISQQAILKNKLVWNRSWPSYENFGTLGYFKPTLTARGYEAYGDAFGSFCAQPLEDQGMGRKLMTKQTGIFFELGYMGGTAPGGNRRSANSALDSCVLVSVHMTNPFFAVNGWLKEVDSGFNRLFDVIRRIDYYDFGEDGSDGVFAKREGYNIAKVGGDLINAVLRACGCSELPAGTVLMGEYLGMTGTSSWDNPPEAPIDEPGWRHFLLWPGGFGRPVPFRGYRYHVGYGAPHVGDSCVRSMVTLFPEAVYRDDLFNDPNRVILRLRGPGGIFVFRFDTRDTELEVPYNPVCQ